MTLTIRDYKREELEGTDGKKVKAIISFRETERELVACKTNGLCMREMFGADLTQWVGKRVILFPSVWNGDPCIRVWGSPDIKEAFSVEIKLHRKKPFTMKMHTSAGNGSKDEPPPIDTDETGDPEPEMGDAYEEPTGT